MYNNEVYFCDICKKPKVGKEEVRNEVYVQNGEGAGNFPQVCHKCVKAVCEVIQGLKPKPENEEAQ